MEEDIFNSELGRKILALTKAGFRVSDLISDLVFREKIKHQVLEVYKKFSVFNREKNHSELLKEIDILDKYFYLGGHLNLIKEEHLKQLRNGFLVFKSHIVLAANQKTQLSELDNVRHQEIPDIENRINNRNIDNLNAKQKKIMEKFEIKGTLKLSEIMELFPDVSERTIRNELTFLIGLGKITRDGRGNGSFYKAIDSENQ
mgnify:CR=1